MNRLICTLCIALLSLTQAVSTNANAQLPTLAGGDPLFSDQEKRALGESWLRVFRSQVEINNDALLNDYLRQITYRLSEHSQLGNRELQLVIVNDSAVNAFAVPGNVIGIYNGLFESAHTEAEFSAVIAHELAHLSQNHFSRNVERQRQTTLPAMLGLLTGLVLLTTSGSNIGLATILSSQAALIGNQLRYSRRYEQEADRIAISTLAGAGMNPEAVPSMFDRMHQATRYNSRPPDFLLTHPVTQKRIADSRNLVSQYKDKYRTKKKTEKQHNTYRLMRARIQTLAAKSPKTVIAIFNSDLKKAESAVDRSTAQYGLSLAYTKNQQFKKANAILDKLLKKSPFNIMYVLAKADVEAQEERYGSALSLLAAHLALNPGNHPLTMAYSQTLLRSGDVSLAVKTLKKHIQKHRSNPDVWYWLAESYGLAGNTLNLHRARVEYFQLTGNLKQARKQVRYALRLAKEQYATQAKLSQKLAHLKQIEQAMGQFK